MEKQGRRAVVMYKNRRAGIIEEISAGYRFMYDSDFLPDGDPIAVSFPLQAEPFENEDLFPFFKGLLPEGWYREIVSRKLKIDKKDLFGFLMSACEDTIGAVWIRPDG